MEKVSRDVERKGYLLFKQKKARVELETEKRIHLKVKGETEEHAVIFDKEKNEFSCDCQFFALKQKTCSHIIACKILLIKLGKCPFSISRE